MIYESNKKKVSYRFPLYQVSANSLLVLFIVLLSIQTSASQGRLSFGATAGIDYFFHNGKGVRDSYDWGSPNQAIVHYGGEIHFQVFEKIGLAIGTNFHKRPVKEPCIYFPKKEDPGLHLAPIFLINSEDFGCSHTLSREINFIEVPLIFNYIFHKTQKSQFQLGISWAPLFRIKEENSFESLSTGEVKHTVITTGIGHGSAISAHAIHLSSRFPLTNSFDLLCKGVITSDDFKYLRVRTGVNIGVLYNLF